MQCSWTGDPEPQYPQSSRAVCRRRSCRSRASCCTGVPSLAAPSWAASSCAPPTRLVRHAGLPWARAPAAFHAKALGGGWGLTSKTCVADIVPACAACVAHQRGLGCEATAHWQPKSSTNTLAVPLAQPCCSSLLGVQGLDRQRAGPGFKAALGGTNRLSPGFDKGGAWLLEAVRPRSALGFRHPDARLGALQLWDRRLGSGRVGSGALQARPVEAAHMAALGCL